MIFQTCFLDKIIVIARKGEHIMELPVRKLGCLGPRGTYSEEIACLLYPAQQDNLILYTCIDAAIRATASGEIAECVVPVENSLEGAVNVTVDTLAHEVDLLIRKEIILPIRHQLLVKAENNDQAGGKTKPQIIISHPQPLAQCRRYLAKHYPAAELRPVASTAAAAEFVATGAKHCAAIGSSRAAAMYGLTALASDIQDESHNCTRFVLLGREPAVVSSDEGPLKTSLVCQLQGDRPGSLCFVLEEFAKRGINLTRIESRPARTGLGQYIFFLDLEGGLQAETVQAAVAAVSKQTIWLKNLGSYARFQI